MVAVAPPRARCPVTRSALSVTTGSTGAPSPVKWPSKVSGACRTAAGSAGVVQNAVARGRPAMCRMRMSSSAGGPAGASASSR